MRRLRDLLSRGYFPSRIGLRGWLPSAGRGDHISRDLNFDWLRNLGVSFYDDSMIGRIKITGIAPGIGVGPSSAHYENICSCSTKAGDIRCDQSIRVTH